MLFELKANSKLLPKKSQFLLRKSPNFTKQARLRALQTWLSRIQTGLNDKLNKQAVPPSDIRRWITVRPQASSSPPQPPPFDDASDSDNNDDDTVHWIDQYPDEAPHLNTWSTTQEQPVSPFRSLRLSLKNTFIHNFFPTRSRDV